MDTADWELATSRFDEQIRIDYSAVGAPKSMMSRSQLTEFLAGLVGKPELRVHTAVAQVFEYPAVPSEFIAYYSVRHYRGPAEKRPNSLFSAGIASSLLERGFLL